MRFEFSWQNDDGSREQFRTDCPATAELMMRSTVDFPKRPRKVQEEFDRLFGVTRGAFETLLRESGQIEDLSVVSTGIEGLTIRIARSQSQMIDLLDRRDHRF